MDEVDSKRADDICMSAAELKSITGGYSRQADQLRVLHSRGFYRAAILKGRLVLERSHYVAVASGQTAEASRLKVKPPRVKAP